LQNINFKGLATALSLIARIIRMSMTKVICERGFCALNHVELMSLWMARLDVTLSGTSGGFAGRGATLLKVT
jgi:hypothetical protein